MKKRIFNFFTTIVALLLSCFLFGCAQPASSGGDSGGNGGYNGGNGGGNGNSTGNLVGRAFLFEKYDYIDPPVQPDPGSNPGSDPYIPDPGSDPSTPTDVWTTKERKKGTKTESIDYTITDNYVSFYTENVAVYGNATATFTGTEYYDIYEIQQYKNGTPYGTPSEEERLVKRDGTQSSYTFTPTRAGFYTVNGSTVVFSINSKKTNENIWYADTQLWDNSKGLITDTSYTLSLNSSRLVLSSMDNAGGTKKYYWKNISQDYSMKGPEFNPKLRKALSKNSPYVVEIKEGFETTYAYASFSDKAHYKTDSIEYGKDNTGKEWYYCEKPDAYSETPSTEKTIYFGATDTTFLFGNQDLFSSNSSYAFETFNSIEANSDYSKIVLTNATGTVTLYKENIYGLGTSTYPKLKQGGLENNNNYLEDKAWCFQEADFVAIDGSGVALQYDDNTYQLIINGQKQKFQDVVPIKLVSGGSSNGYYGYGVYSSGNKSYSVTGGKDGIITLTAPDNKSYVLKFHSRPTYKSPITQESDIKIEYLYVLPTEENKLDFTAFADINNDTAVITLNVKNISNVNETLQKMSLFVGSNVTDKDSYFIFDGKPLVTKNHNQPKSNSRMITTGIEPENIDPNKLLADYLANNPDDKAIFTEEYSGAKNEWGFYVDEKEYGAWQQQHIEKIASILDKIGLCNYNPTSYIDEKGIEHFEYNVSNIPDSVTFDLSTDKTLTVVANNTLKRDFTVKVNKVDLSTKHTITFNNNNDECTETIDNAEFVEGFGKKLPILTTTNYNFLGWSKAQDGSLGIFTGYDVKDLTQDITLYGIWEPKMIKTTIEVYYIPRCIDNSTQTVSSEEITVIGKYGETLNIEEFGKLTKVRKFTKSYYDYSTGSSESKQKSIDAVVSYTILPPGEEVAFIKDNSNNKFVTPALGKIGKDTNLKLYAFEDLKKITMSFDYMTFKSSPDNVTVDSNFYMDEEYYYITNDIELWSLSTDNKSLTCELVLNDEKFSTDKVAKSLNITLMESSFHDLKTGESLEYNYDFANSTDISLIGAYSYNH